MCVFASVCFLVCACLCVHACVCMLVRACLGVCACVRKLVCASQEASQEAPQCVRPPSCPGGSPGPPSEHLGSSGSDLIPRPTTDDKRLTKLRRRNYRRFYITIAIPTMSLYSDRSTLVYIYIYIYMYTAHTLAHTLFKHTFYCANPGAHQGTD